MVWGVAVFFGRLGQASAAFRAGLEEPLNVAMGATILVLRRGVATGGGYASAGGSAS